MRHFGEQEHCPAEQLPLGSTELLTPESDLETALTSGVHHG